MTAQQLNVDTIANNLANSSTAGFKARRSQFQDLIYQSMIQPGASAGQQTVVPGGLQLGLGTRAATNEVIFTQGNFAHSDNPLDIVIQGKGLFQIRRATGDIAYTRAGVFQLDKSGNMVTVNQDYKLHYPAPQFDADLIRAGEDYFLRINAKTLLRDVCINVDRLDPEATINDQMITIFPGDGFSFVIRSQKELTTEQLTSPPVFQCANRFGARFEEGNQP